MRRMLSLDGDVWQRREFPDEAWRWSDAVHGVEDSASPGGPPAKASSYSGWRPGRVPGSTLLDALRAGEVPVIVLAGRFGDAVTRRLLSRTADLAAFRRLPAAITATVDVAGEDWSVRVHNGGSVVALEVRLEDARPVGWPERSGHGYLGANFVTLLPGEARDRPHLA